MDSAQSSTKCIFGVVGVLRREHQLLLIQRSRNIRAGGMWCFPGGEIEKGESPDEAIVREFHEEVGLAIEAQRKLWSHTKRDGSLSLEWWQVTATEFEIKMQLAEIMAYKWLTIEEIRIHENLLPNNLEFLDHYESMI